MFFMARFTPTKSTRPRVPSSSFPSKRDYFCICSILRRGHPWFPVSQPYGYLPPPPRKFRPRTRSVLSRGEIRGRRLVVALHNSAIKIPRSRDYHRPRAGGLLGNERAFLGLYSFLFPFPFAVMHHSLPPSLSVSLRNPEIARGAWRQRGPSVISLYSVIPPLQRYVPVFFIISYSPQCESVPRVPTWAIAIDPVRLPDVRFLSDTTCFIADGVRIRRLVPHNSAIKIRPSASMPLDDMPRSTPPRVIFARRCIRLGITAPAPPPPLAGSSGPATRCCEKSRPPHSAAPCGLARDKIARDVRGMPRRPLAGAPRRVSEAKIQSFPSHSGPRASIRDVISVSRLRLSPPRRGKVVARSSSSPSEGGTFLFILEFPCQ